MSLKSSMCWNATKRKTQLLVVMCCLCFPLGMCFYVQKHSVRLGARSSQYQPRRSRNSEMCRESVIQNYKASSPLGQKQQQRVAKTVEEDSEKSFPCDSTQKYTKWDPATSRNKSMQFINDPGKAKYFIHAWCDDVAGLNKKKCCSLGICCCGLPGCCCCCCSCCWIWGSWFKFDAEAVASV